jgi:cytochrome c oxidase subunit IV
MYVHFNKFGSDIQYQGLQGYFSINSIVRFGFLDIPNQHQGFSGCFSMMSIVIFGFWDILAQYQGLQGYFSINSIVIYIEEKHGVCDGVIRQQK